MASHKKVGGMVISLPAPYKFKKRNSAYNICIGKELAGQAGGGRNKAWNDKFAAAARACSKMV